MTENPKHFFEQKIVEYQQALLETKKKVRTTSVMRILVFFAMVFSIYLASLTTLWIVAIVSITGSTIFIRLVILHTKLFRKQQWYEALHKINLRELQLYEKKSWPELAHDIQPEQEHPYAGDLDLFGQRSLFQLINRTATHCGQELLAERLLHPVMDGNDIKNRQEAIKELAEMSQLRQDFQASGSFVQDNPETIADILKWVTSKNSVFNHLFYKIMLVLNPLLASFTIYMVSEGRWNESAFVLFLSIPFLLIGGRLGLIGKQHSQLTKKGALLEKYAALLQLIEKEYFKSKLLTEAKNTLLESQYSTHKALRKLSKISEAFDFRLNLLMGVLLNIFFLWDIIQIIRLENWKKRYGNSVQSWFDQLALMDELSSFAGFAFQHPESTYPNISEKDFELKASNAKHPFIPSANCVGNEIDIKSWKEIHIITGANMAGKSTYLRTVGINLLLAMTGAPVLADRFVFKPVSLFTGIVTSDSLQDGESYFFAELKRLKEIIDALEGGQKLFIILDEILRGTNSMDKQKGSKGMIKQLIRLGASGMIATHDLSLGELADSFPEHVCNKRFEVEIQADELVFDYKLKDGISENLNATFLMKKMKII